MARNEQQLSELSQEIERFTKFDKESLITRKEWGTINLEDSRPDFDRTYDIINYLKVLPVDILTIKALTGIKNEIAAINDLFDQINEFSIETGTPAPKRDQFIN